MHAIKLLLKQPATVRIYKDGELKGSKAFQPGTYALRGDVDEHGKVIGFNAKLADGLIVFPNGSAEPLCPDCNTNIAWCECRKEL